MILGDISDDAYFIGTIIGIIQGLAFLGDRLWKKTETPVTEQSLMCGFQHKAFSDSLVQQTEALKDMCGSLRTVASDAQLRHQIIVDKLDRLNEKFKP